MAKKSIEQRQKEIVVAKVNGAAILTGQVEDGLQSMLDPYRDSKGKVRLPQQEQYGAREYVIDNLIKRELLFQAGKKKGITHTPEELETVMNDMLKEYGSETQFKYALSLKGRTIEQYREQMKYDIVVNKMAADIVRDKKKEVTKEEARRYYDEHPEEMTGAEVRHLQHVMIKVDRYAPEAVVKKARKKLEQVAADPKKFAEIVEKGPEAGEEIKGVDAGFVARGSIHPLLDSVAGRLAEGKISRVIKTEEGFHLLLVKKILPADIPRPYAYIESDLIHKLYEQRSVAILDAEIEKLRAKADIVIMDKMAANKREQEDSLSE